MLREDGSLDSSLWILPAPVGHRGISTGIYGDIDQGSAAGRRKSDHSARQRLQVTLKGTAGIQGAYQPVIAEHIDVYEHELPAFIVIIPDLVRFLIGIEGMPLDIIRLTVDDMHHTHVGLPASLKTAEMGVSIGNPLVVLIHQFIAGSFWCGIKRTPES